MNQDSALAQAESLLLAPFSLTEGDLSRTFGQILSHQVDYADLYFQYSRSEAWSLDEGIVKSGSFNIDQGVGVRAISGEKTAFAYSDDISSRALTDAASAVRAIAAAGQSGILPAFQGSTAPRSKSPGGQQVTHFMCRTIRLPRCRPRPRSSCWNAWKASPALSIRG